MLQIKDEETPRGLTSRLLLRQTRREDTAVFVCKAENRFGASQRVVHLVVQESNNSDFVYNIFFHHREISNFGSLCVCRRFLKYRSV